MTEKKSMACEDKEVQPTLEHTPSSNHTSDKEDPTNRWTERVREMIEAKNTPGNVHNSNDQEKIRQCPLRVDIQAMADYAQESIAKRPLTSMVIAATAGATITALLAAMISSGRRGRH